MSHRHRSHGYSSRSQDRPPSAESFRRAQASQIKLACERLQAGEAVIIPTESGYRLVCRCDQESSLRRLYELLRRASGRPLTLHVCEPAALDGWAVLTPSASKLLAAYTPGPLVVLTPRAERTSPLITAELAKVAVRVPHHPAAQELLRSLPWPLAGASIRTAEGVAVCHGDQVRVCLDTGKLMLLEGRDTLVGLEPTVADATRDPVRILTSGFLSREDLARALGHSPILAGDRPTPRRQARYAPQARLIVVEGTPERVPRRLRTLIETYSITDKVALLVTQETAESSFCPPPRGVAQFSVLGSRTRLQELEQNLSRALTRLEQDMRATLILVEGVPREGFGAMVMERLCQPAHQVINTEDPGYSGQAGMQLRRRPG